MNKQSQRALLSKAFAEELDNGGDVAEIAAETGLSKTEILNMADNFRARGFEEQTAETGYTGYTFDSTILANSFAFAGANAGRSYLKKKQAALKAQGQQQAELINEAKEARTKFISYVPFMPESSFEDIVTEFCGLGREWNASGKMVKQFAEANGVDQALAADLVGRQMTVAQDYAQATRGLNFGRYLGWLQDAAAEADDHNTPKDIEEITLQAYHRAAQWNQPADGLLIREFAVKMGIVECLPTWADCLKANMPTAEQALEARKRIANRAAAAASAEQEAEQELTQAYGAF